MSIAQLFETKSTVFSFEVFPPKRTSPIETIYSTLDELQELHPDFISVTYGAGGNLADNSTCEIASIIKNHYHIEPLAHLTCVNSTEQEIMEVLGRLKQNGIENILALRGDISPDRPPKTDFAHASDLISFIKKQGGFHVSGACYPEGHIECDSLVDDVLHLRQKVDAGAEHLVSQLFFDNDSFYRFVERARIAGIQVPIEAGIMPVVNKKQIERMVSLCGASLPPKFTKVMSRYEHNPQALRDAGIAYAIDQIVDLVSNNVQGIHLYTMNNPYVARRISESVSSLLRA
ncbi:methylenetetrahydrofolate reductase [NAD(P)H] [[Clostridium] leptum]|nr:methylenetetrahydrofolate reductase [NAD(P)H] [[Clostridium] leptum]